MQKIIMGNATLRAWSRAFMLAISLIVPACMYGQSRTKKVSIKPPDKHIVLANYKITNLVDDRLKPGNIGYLTTYATNKFLMAELEAPLTQELKSYLDDHVTQATGGTPISLHVINFFLSEEMESGAMAKMRFRVHFAVFNEAGERLLDVSTMHEKFTGPARVAFAGQLLGSTTETLLRDIDKLLPEVLTRYADPTPLPVFIVLNNSHEDKNLLPYSNRHPINLSNFGGHEPAANTRIAGTDVGFSFSYQIRQMDGKWKAIIEIAPYFRQSAAWIKKGADVKQAGAYAQNHFDLAAIVACDFADAFDKKKFTFSQLKSETEALRKEYEQKLKTELDKQITETGGGYKVEELEDWLDTTDFEMRSVDCYD